MTQMKDTESTEYNTVTAARVKIVHYFAVQGYVQWYTKVEDISHLYILHLNVHK